MTAATNIYTFPVSRDLQAAREVMADPKAHPADAVETAVTVLDWHGTDEDRAKIAHLPDPGLVTGRLAEQLADARKVGAWVKMGKAMSQARLACALEVLEAHGQDAADAALAIQIEAALMLARMKARGQAVEPPPYSPQTRVIRSALVDCAGLAVILAVVVAFLNVGGAQ